MRVLVSGGAGYIGSHTVVQLVAAGHEVVVVDNFANAKPSVVGRLEALTGQPLDVHSFDLTDHDKTEHLFAHEHDRRRHPLRRVQGRRRERRDAAGVLREQHRLDLLPRARDAPARGRRTWSSRRSATVYGDDAPVPMQEDLPTSATNPYGWTKVMQEQILRDVAAADPTLRIALLRYFNPVGAHPSGTIGEDPSGIPNNLMPYHRPGRRRPPREAAGVRRRLPDARRHRRARLHPRRGPRRRPRRRPGPARRPPTHPVSTWNLGTGHGTSVLELLARVRAGLRPRAALRGRGPSRRRRRRRRTPTPRARRAELGWRATRTVDDMCADTWRWQSRNPHGYPEG